MSVQVVAVMLVLVTTVAVAVDKVGCCHDGGVENIVTAEVAAMVVVGRWRRWWRQ